MTITVLIPTDQPIRTAFEMAPRPVSLKGLTLGLIDNGKRNSDVVVTSVARRLTERHGIQAEIHVRKPSPSHGIAEDAARELAQKAQVVIAGIGD